MNKQELIDEIVNIIPKGQQTYVKGKWISSRKLARDSINELLQSLDNNEPDKQKLIDFPSDEEIYKEAVEIGKNIKIFPFDQASFQYGAEWMRGLIKDQKTLSSKEPEENCIFIKDCGHSPCTLTECPEYESNKKRI
jgi:hypothetical protein